MSFANKRQLSRGIYPGSLHTKALNMITEFNGNASALTCKFSQAFEQSRMNNVVPGNPSGRHGGSLFIRANDLQFETVFIFMYSLFPGR